MNRTTLLVAAAVMLATGLAAGRKQSELTEFIRIGRIDDEQFMLTEDYQKTSSAPRADPTR